MRPTKTTAPAAMALAALLSACTSSTPGSTTSITGSCIRPVEIQKQTIVSDEEIRFELRNGDIWANKLPHACPGLKLQGGFSWKVHGDLVCSNQQTIYVLEDGTPCQLGEFTKLPEQPKS